MDANWALLAQLLTTNPYAAAGWRHPLATCAGWALHLDADTLAPRYERLDRGTTTSANAPPPEWVDATAATPPLATLECTWRGAHQAWQVHRDGATLTQYFVRVDEGGGGDADTPACSWAPPPGLVAADLLCEAEGALIAWEADVAYSYALSQESCGGAEGAGAGADADGEVSAGTTAEGIDDAEAEAVAAYLRDTQRVRAAVQMVALSPSPSPDDAGAGTPECAEQAPACLLARVRGGWEVWEAGVGHPTAAGCLYYYHRPSGACSWLVPGDITQAAGDDDAWEVVAAAAATGAPACTEAEMTATTATTDAAVVSSPQPAPFADLPITMSSSKVQLPSPSQNGEDGSQSSWRQRRAERRAALQDAGPLATGETVLASPAAPPASGDGAPSEPRRARRRSVAPTEPPPSATPDASACAPLAGCMDVSSLLHPLDDGTCAQPLQPTAAAAVWAALSLPPPTAAAAARRRSSADGTLLSVVRAVEAATSAAQLQSAPADESAAAVAAAADTNVGGDTVIVRILQSSAVPAWLATAMHSPALLPSPPPEPPAATGGGAAIDGDASWRHGLGLGLGHAFGKGAVVATRHYGGAAAAALPPPPPLPQSLPSMEPAPTGGGSEQIEATAAAAATSADECAVRRTLARVKSRREHATATAVETVSPAHGAVAADTSLRAVPEVAWVDHHLYDAADEGDVASLTQLAAAVGTSPAQLADEIARWTRRRERAVAAGGGSGGGRRGGSLACTSAGGFSMSLWARWCAGQAHADESAACADGATAATAAVPPLQAALQAWEAAERDRLKGARSRLAAAHDAEVERRRLAAAIERARRHAGVSAAVGGIAAAKAATGEATRAALAAARAQALAARDAALAASKVRVARMRG